VRPQAVNVGRPGPHEIAAAGEEPQENPLPSSRLRSSSIGWYTVAGYDVPKRGCRADAQPGPAQRVELLGGDVGVGEGYQLHQSLHALACSSSRLVGRPSWAGLRSSSEAA
jgi:hypothetical protein